jgi:hypothetical protein
MDAIVWLIIMVLSAWLAYEVVAGERRARMWGGARAIGAYLAIFGAASVGLLNIWTGLLRPKLVDDFSSENTLLFVGLVTLAVLVVGALDLLGMIDVMSKMRAQMDRVDVGRPGPGAD